MGHSTATGRSMKLLICLIAGLQLCWATQSNSKWLLAAMFVKNKHCPELIELIELQLISEADLVPDPKVLKKGYFYCKEILSKFEFESITDEEYLLYNLIEIVAVQDLEGLLRDLSKNSGISRETLSRRAFLVGCAAGIVPVIDQVVHLQKSRIINLGFVLACFRTHLPTMQYLLDHVTPDEFLVERSMMLACMLGSIPIVSFLLDSFEMNESEYLGSAAYGGSLEIVRLLMEDPRFKCTNDISKALEWAVRLKYTDIALYIIEQDGSFKAIAFKKACKYLDISLLKSLLDGDHELNVQIGLNVACQNGHFVIVNLLMDTGRAKVNSDTLYYAAKSGNIDLVSWVLQQPAVDVNMEMEHGTLFSQLVKEIPLSVLELIIKHDLFTIDTLLSAFCLEDARRLLLLPAVHTVLFAYKGDAVMRALSREATIIGLLPLFCHPCISNAQISAAAHILKVEDDPRAMGELHLIMASKAGQLDRCIELCVKGDVRAFVEVGAQCAAANEHPQLLACLLKMYHRNSATEIEGCGMMKIDYIVGVCCCLRATRSLRIIWEWLGHQFPLIHDILSMTRPLQVRVITKELDGLDDHLDLICQSFDSVMSSLGEHEHLVRLARCYRDHFLLMISMYEACPVIPLEYSEEMLTAMLISMISLKRHNMN